MLRNLVDKSRRAFLRYVPPEITRHVPAPLMGPRPLPGPPPGISLATLDAICAEHLGGRIKHCAHHHLSAWKRHGTFRLYVTSESGRQRTFIFKDEIYTADENPALDGLPVLPGPPEYYIYVRSVDSAFSTFLPTLFWCVEVEPGRHFRYLLEDLRLAYRRLYFKKKDLLFAVRALIDAQKAMKLTLTRNDEHGLIRYDDAYSEEMIEYARSNLEGFARSSGDHNVKEILKLWPLIIKHHQDNSSSHDDGLSSPIHGDYTLAHIHWKHGANAVKIVDWEWAGIGLPHADLAALIKWTAPEFRKEALGIFAGAFGQLELEEHARLLRRCLLERKLLDAGFFARRKVVKEKQVGSRYFRRSVADVLAIAQGAK